MGDSARCRRAAGRRRSPGPCRSGHRKPRWANTSVKSGEFGDPSQRVTEAS